MRSHTDLALAILDASNCGETVAVSVAYYIRKGDREYAQRLLCRVCQRISPEAATEIINEAVAGKSQQGLWETP